MTTEHSNLTGERRLLSVIVPCYNESEVLALFHDRLRPVLESMPELAHEILFVDDGSSDDTLDQLNRFAVDNPNVRVCSLSRNFGHQVALTAGLDYANGDAIVMLDSDLQHPPELIEQLVEKWHEGYDVVSAVRINTKGAGWMKNLTSRAFYVFLNFLSDTKVPAGVADFCLISKRMGAVLEHMPERHKFLRGMISWAGFRRAFISYEATPRAAGRTKYSAVKMMVLALDAVFSFSSAPLRLALRAGLTTTALGFLYLGWTLINGYLLDALVPGYASLIGVTMILGGFQLSFIGLVGQYLARVFEEVKGRPIYIVKQEPAAPNRS